MLIHLEKVIMILLSVYSILLEEGSFIYTPIFLLFKERVSNRAFSLMVIYDHVTSQRLRIRALHFHNPGYRSLTRRCFIRRISLNFLKFLLLKHFLKLIRGWDNNCLTKRHFHNKKRGKFLYQSGYELK